LPKVEAERKVVKVAISGAASPTQEANNAQAAGEKAEASSEAISA